MPKKDDGKPSARAAGRPECGRSELLARHKFHSQAQAMPVVFEFIEGWYNTHRRHSVLGQISPLRFERRHAERLEGVAS